MSQSPSEPLNQLLPYNKVISRITTEVGAQAAVASLVAAGFPENETYILHGEEGQRYIDIDGSGHGFFGRLVRSYMRLQGIEKQMMDDADEALKSGQYLVGVDVDGSEEQQVQARDALVAHTDFNIYFCGRYTITIVASAKRYD